MNVLIAILGFFLLKPLLGGGRSNRPRSQVTGNANTGKNTPDIFSGLKSIAPRENNNQKGGILSTLGNLGTIGKAVGKVTPSDWWDWSGEPKKTSGYTEDPWQNNYWNPDEQGGYGGATFGNYVDDQNDFASADDANYSDYGAGEDSYDYWDSGYDSGDYSGSYGGGYDSGDYGDW